MSVLFLMVTVIGCSKENPTAREPPEEEEQFMPKDHLIGVKSTGGEAEFYNADNDESFIPRGVSYFYIVNKPEGGLEECFRSVTEL